MNISHQPETAEQELRTQRTRKCLEIYAKLGHLILSSEAKQTYFKRAMSKNHLSTTCVPQIYGIYRVHKKDVMLHPSIPELFSKHVNYWLKTIIKNLLPT
jgi:hypothetical protein